MPTLSKTRASANRNTENRNPPTPASPDFAAGSLEEQLSAIGKSATAKAWSKLPPDFFANLDHYRHGAPKRK